MRNHLQRTEDFNNRLITRRQGNLEGAPSFAGGAQSDIPNPAANALRILEDYLCFPDRLEPRTGSQQWSTITLPALVGRTNYTVTKSGTTVTHAGASFTAADVGSYIVYADGAHERISAYIGATSVTVESSATHAAYTGVWLHGPVNMLAYHRKRNRIVIQIDTRFFISDQISLTGWYQIFQAGPSAPTSTKSTYDEQGDYLLVFNANGIFKLDCASTGTSMAPCVYWKINEAFPVPNLTGESDTEIYKFRYFFTFSRISGTGYSRDRTTNAVEQQTPPMPMDTATSDHTSRDYLKNSAQSAAFAGMNPAYTTFTALNASQFTHLSVFRTLDIGVNGIDPQTGKGNNQELVIWAGDVPLRRSCIATQPGTTTVTSTTDIFTANDVGSLLYSSAAPGGTFIVTVTNSKVAVVADAYTVTAGPMSLGSSQQAMAAQAISTDETVGNSTVTRSSGSTFSASNVGEEIVWATGERSTIVRYIDANTVEVAQGASISSTAMCFGHSGWVSYMETVSDTILRQRAAGLSLKNRFTVPMPNCNLGTVAGGMIWGANRDSGNIYYSQIPNNEQYYGGYYREAGEGAQIDELPDGIQAMGEFVDRVVFYCNQSSWFISVNDFYTVTLPEVGEVIAVATGHWPISDIGVKDWGSIRRIAGVKFSDLQQSMGDIMVCSDGGVRICDGGKFSADLSMSRIKKTLQAQANGSASAYDPINGYLLWRTDGTLTDATHSYRFGVESEVQGIGWSKNVNGDFPMLFAGVGGIVILDTASNYHSLVLDAGDGFFYDISTRDGSSGSGMTRLTKDKVLSVGTGGTDISTAVEFIPERGTEEHFTQEHLESHIYTRPYSEARGYLSGLAFTLKIYKNSDTDPVAQTVSVDQDNDIVFDKKVEARQLRIRVEASKADHLLTGRLNSFLSKDKAATPLNRTMAERGYQKTLGNVALWVSRKNHKVINRKTGLVVVDAPTLTTGPDGYSDSGIQIAAALTGPSVTVTSKPILIWADGAIAITIGGDAVSLAAHGVVDSFTLYYGTATGSGAVVITPTGTRVISDLRIINETLSTAARTYYYDDVADNAGKVVMPR